MKNRKTIIIDIYNVWLSIVFDVELCILSDNCILLDEKFLGFFPFLFWIHTCFDKLTQIAFMCWANVGFPLATLLGQRWKMTLAQWNFAYMPLVGPTSWASVGPMISANKVYNLPTRYQQILVENYGGPPMAHPWPNNEPTVSSHQLTSMWFN